MRNSFLLFMMVSFIVISACEKKVDITAKNKAILLRAEELWNTGNMAIADEIFATDFVNHDPNAPEVIDLEDYKKFIVTTRTGFSDFHVTLEDMIAEGDKVANRWTARGTHQGDLFGIPPTNKQATWTGISIYRFADGKIVEAWWSKDMLGLLQQLGVIPPIPDVMPALERKGEEFLWSEPSKVTGDPGDPEANKDLTVSEVLEGWNQGDIDVILGTTATNFVNHDPIWPGVTDRKTFKHWVESELADGPGEIIIEDIILERDKIAYRWTALTGKGPIPGMSILRFADGKIVERWWSKDILNILQQLGVIPPPEQG